MKHYRPLAAFALTLLVSASAFAGDLTTPGDPESLGFSSERLARIASWHQARVDSITASDPIVPGAVVAIAKDGKLAYLQPIGFQDRASPSSCRRCRTTNFQSKRPTTRGSPSSGTPPARSRAPC